MNLSHEDLHAFRRLAAGTLKRKLKRLENFKPRADQSEVDAELGRQKIARAVRYWTDLVERIRRAEGATNRTKNTDETAVQFLPTWTKHGHL
jgi:hypothetical protein